MPVITMFYGIIVKIFFKDHNPPHIHAIYNEYNGVFDIQKLEMTEGDLPPRAQKLVIEWCGYYKKELLEMWQNQEFRKLPGLK